MFDKHANVLQLLQHGSTISLSSTSIKVFLKFFISNTCQTYTSNFYVYPQIPDTQFQMQAVTQSFPQTTVES